MPNQLEEELKAVHSTIAVIKRELKTEDHPLQKKFLKDCLCSFEEKRVELLKNMGVEL